MLRVEARLSERANLVICAAITAGVAALMAVAFRELPGPRKDFYDNLWAPANLLAHGQNPYLPASIKTGLPTLWLPMVLGPFLPLGMLTAEVATQVWFIINTLEAAIIVLLAQGEKRKPIISGAAALALYLFPATIQHFVLGQFALTATLCLMLASRCARKAQDWPAAFLLALACTKPQLAFVAGIGLLVFCWKQSGLGRAVLFGMRWAGAAVVLSLPMLASPTPWLPAWWENMTNNPAWLHPSLFSVLRGSLGNWGSAIWACLAAAGLFACILLWMYLQAEAAMAWTIALTTIVAPYIWSWDFVLLMPLWISAFARANWRKKTLLILVYAAGWAGMALAQVRAEANNQAFWWVPLWFVLALAALNIRELRDAVPAGAERLIPDLPTERFSRKPPGANS